MVSERWETSTLYCYFSYFVACILLGLAFTSPDTSDDTLSVGSWQIGVTFASDVADVYYQAPPANFSLSHNVTVIEPLVNEFSFGIMTWCFSNSSVTACTSTSPGYSTEFVSSSDHVTLYIDPRWTQGLAAAHVLALLVNIFAFLLLQVEFICMFFLNLTCTATAFMLDALFVAYLRSVLPQLDAGGSVKPGTVYWLTFGTLLLYSPIFLTAFCGAAVPSKLPSRLRLKRGRHADIEMQVHRKGGASAADAGSRITEITEETLAIEDGPSKKAEETLQVPVLGEARVSQYDTLYNLKVPQGAMKLRGADDDVVVDNA